MQHFADVDQRSLANKYDGTFVNLNPPVVAAIEKATRTGSDACGVVVAGSCASRSAGTLGDGGGIAEGVERAGAGFSVTVDAKAGKVTEALQCSR